jgi:membrane-associated phospholipid phosphatase
MFDPLVGAIGVGFVAAVVAGPAIVYGLELVSPRWRRPTEWLLITAALGGAIAARVFPLWFVYVLAALPGLVAFLAFRSFVASALVSLAPLYFVFADLTRGRPAHAPAIALDALFQLEPAWMLVYGSLYPFVVPLPLLVVRERELLRRAMQGYLAVMLVSYAGFLLYPTVAPRPAEVPGDGFAAWTLRIAYDIDPPHGCFPSLHVAYAFVSALTCYRVHRGVGAAAALWAALIGLSTLYTKQHYFVDVIAGALAAFAAYALFVSTYPHDAIDEHDREKAPSRAIVGVAIYGVIIGGFWVAYRWSTRPL